MEQKTYSQQWSEYNKAQTREKALFMKLLYDLCQNIEEPEYKFGRPKLSLSDIIFCSVFKVYSLYSGRRFTSDMKLAKKMDLITKAPHYNSIFNYLKKRELTPLLKRLIEISSLPLKSVERDFAIDASGFSTTRFGRWFLHKHKRNVAYKIWVKAHIMVGTRTQIISAVEITTGNDNDCPLLPKLVKETAKNFSMMEVSADKAYSSRVNLKAISEAGAMPYIPFRKNARPTKRGGPKLWGKMWHFFNLNKELFEQHYHKRSNSETAFHMIKSKFGDSVRSRKYRSQVNEVLCKILCHNICVVIHEMYELGIMPNF